MALTRVPPPSRPARAGNGRYEVGQLLGRGGMAEVFDGRSLGSHGFEKRVAIKRILPELAGDQTFTSRLVVEAKLAVAMQHVNIVQALDLVRDGQDVFLVMEFVNGPTLRRLLQERYGAGAGPLPLGLSTFVLHEAAAGLDYAHTQPGGAVIHADISPSNLLISRAGEVKLADFGIARREGIARAAEGKWGYMSPEQERGAPLSPRADLYALGVVLYELLTGVHPFSSRSARIPRASEPLIAPHQVRPDLPRRLSELCCQMLATAVFDRPASAREVVEQLAELRYREGWREGRSELATAVGIVPELVVSAPAPAAAPDERLPPRQATEHTAHPLRNATEMTRRPLTLVTSSLLAERGERLGPSGPAVGTGAAGLPFGHGPGAMMMSPVPGTLAAVPGGVMMSPVPGTLAAVPGGMHDAHTAAGGLSSSALAATAGGTHPPGNWTSRSAPTAPITGWPWAMLSSRTRTWLILGAAALVGVLWGITSVIRESDGDRPVAPAAMMAVSEPGQPERSGRSGRPGQPVHDASGERPEAGQLAPSAASADGADSAGGAADAGGAPSGTNAAAGAGAAGALGAEANPAGRGATPAGQLAEPPGAGSIAAAAGAAAGSQDRTIAAAGSAGKPSIPIRSAGSGGNAGSRPEAGDAGTLRVYAEPWAYVQVGDTRVETPARITLRPGQYVVRLANPELGLTRTEKVRIRSKEMTTLKVRWNE